MAYTAINALHLGHELKVERFIQYGPKTCTDIEAMAEALQQHTLRAGTRPRYGWLMQYEDGNTDSLGFEPEALAGVCKGMAEAVFEGQLPAFRIATVIAPMPEPTGRRSRR